MVLDSDKRHESRQVFSGFLPSLDGRHGYFKHPSYNAVVLLLHGSPSYSENIGYRQKLKEKSIDDIPLT